MSLADASPVHLADLTHPSDAEPPAQEDPEVSLSSFVEARNAQLENLLSEVEASKPRNEERGREAGMETAKELREALGEPVERMLRPLHGVPQRSLKA